jgi:ABC-2 type transport system permease protein
MIRTLVAKLLRDVAVGLGVVALLLFAFQCLWARVAERVTTDILQELGRYVPISLIRDVVFKGSGQIIQALMGGADIRIEYAQDMLSISYVHPLTQAILCVWAVGRAAGALAGELDRGTMELLLAQPVPRRNLPLAHLCVDLLTIPCLCLTMWAGTWLGAALVGFLDNPEPNFRADPMRFAPGLLNVAALVFAVSGYTLWLSSLGRFRGAVLGLAVVLTLAQFLVNVIGQVWDAAEVLRPLTVFYYYQPQPMMLAEGWYEQQAVWRRLGVLLGVGASGYLLALWTFTRRDLPAPL